MTTPFNPELHVFHRAQVGEQTPLPPAPAGRELVNVWRVLDEKALREHGLVHGKTAFLEGHGHDWMLRPGNSLRYSTRQAEKGQWLDVLLDYQTALEARIAARTAVARFDPMTGQPLANPSSEPAMRPAFDPSLHVLYTIKTGLKQANDLPPPPEGRELRRIWTVIDTSRLEELGPQHNLTGFLEEKNHDWSIDDKGQLRFYSRVVETNASVEVILDYETAAEMNERIKAHAPARKPATPKPR